MKIMYQFTGRKYIISVLFVNLMMAGCTETKSIKEFNAADLVNPLMGTDSEYRLSTGNTYPAIAMPWGMNFWTPQTGKMGNGWIYTYNATRIYGLRQTHQPSPWINDYAAFSLMPVTGKLVYKEDDRASWFSHKSETVKPYYYSVYLADHDVTAEIAPTERAAMFRFTFPSSDSSFIVLDGFNKGSMVTVIPSERKIIGYCRNNNGGVPDNFHNYFVAVFDREFEYVATWHGDTLTRNSLEAKGKHAGAIVGFKTKNGDKVNVRVASSFISPEQALINLDRETRDRDFEKIMASATKSGTGSWGA